MDTLDKYLLKEALPLLLLLLAGLTLLFVGVDFLSNFWRSSLPIGTVTLTYIYRIPNTIQLFVPMACLMATLLVLSSMSRQNEILALNASGVGTLRILSTFIALVATVSTATFLILDPIAPVFNRKNVLIARGLDPGSSENLSSFDRSNFWYRSGKLVYNVGLFSPQNNTLRDVKIYLFAPSFYLLQRIHATEAVYENGDWVLKKGLVTTYPPDSHFPMAVPFETKRHVIPEKPKDFKTYEFRDDTMRLRDLRQYIERNRGYGLDTTEQQVNYHERVAAVFTPLILIMIGFPFAMKPLRNQSTASSVVFCFGVVLMFIVVSRLSLSVGKNGHIVPFVAAWAPNLFFLAIASFRLMKG